MKKIMSVLLALISILLISGCGSDNITVGENELAFRGIPIGATYSKVHKKLEADLKDCLFEGYLPNGKINRDSVTYRGKDLEVSSTLIADKVYCIFYNLSMDESKYNNSVFGYGTYIFTNRDKYTPDRIKDMLKQKYGEPKEKKGNSSYDIIYEWDGFDNDAYIQLGTDYYSDKTGKLVYDISVFYGSHKLFDQYMEAMKNAPKETPNQANQNEAPKPTNGF